MTLCTHLLLVSEIKNDYNCISTRVPKLMLTCSDNVLPFPSYSLPHNKYIIYFICALIYIYIYIYIYMWKFYGLETCTICTLHRQWTGIKILHDKLLAAQLVKFLVLDVTWRFITLSTVAHHWANIHTYSSTYSASDMTHADHATYFDYSIHVNIAQLMNPLLQFSPVSCHFLLLWCKHSHHYIPY